MQATPLRLQQAIRTAFQASKPIRRPTLEYRISSSCRQVVPQPARQLWHKKYIVARHFSDKKNHSLEEKIKDAHQRVDDAIESRADTIATPQKELKRNETIVHTNPESSSIVHTSTSIKKPPGKNSDGVKDATTLGPLPSQTKLKQSDVRRHFSNFMDNFQSHVFVASRRLNDLTGYSGIEALKKEIEKQEDSVYQARKLVKDTRQRYSAAIDNRSTTQKEVNDLLHRKHAWSPEDLQRFTDLYRSDHANEQAEQKAHEELSQAESQYEEASTKLAKGILARYHEEQIWSDKIRQMSTWGTWGLMGLNVLLFIVFQILVEPWRRQRLVKGFEEKVQEALKDSNKDPSEVSKTLRANEIVQQAVEEQPRQSVVVLAGEKVGEAVADALGGADTSSEANIKVPAKEDIEQAADQVVSAEMSQEDATAATVMAISETVEEGGSPNLLPEMEESPSANPLQDLTSNVFAQASAGYAVYQNRFQEMFSDTELVIISRRDLTTATLEGIVAGAAFMATLLWAVGRGK